MVHYCSTESQCKDYKEKPGSCGSAAVPLLEIASKKKKTKHCKSCREANLGDHLLKYQGKIGSGRWTLLLFVYFLIYKFPCIRTRWSSRRSSA